MPGVVLSPAVTVERLRFRSTVWLFLALSGFPAAFAVEPDSPGEVQPAPVNPLSEALDRYLSASEKPVRVHEGSVEMDIEAKLPRLKKEATLHALQEIGPGGRIVHTGARGEGDKTVIKDVIARYLSAEEEASKGLSDHQGKPLSIAISPENYRFRQKAVLTAEGRRIYVFHVLPRKNRLGLFKGEIWIDGASGIPLREAGRLVKSPSVFLRKVDFVREYDIRGGRAYLTRIESAIDTRLVGRAELVIRYSNHTAPVTPVEAAQNGSAEPGG